MRLVLVVLAALNCWLWGYVGLVGWRTLARLEAIGVVIDEPVPWTIALPALAALASVLTAAFALRRRRYGGGLAVLLLLLAFGAYAMLAQAAGAGG